MPVNKNYYEILKVSPLASPSAIKKSYQNLVRVHHPDKNLNNPEAAENFKRINEAYQILSDTFKRKDFDRQIKQEKQKEEQEKNKASFSPMYESYNSYSPFAEQATNLHASHTSPPSHPYHPSQGGPPPPAGQTANNPQLNPDLHSIPPHKTDSFSIKNYFFKKSNTVPSNQIHKQLEISMEEAALGCKKNISMRVMKNGIPKTELFLIYIPPGTKEKQNINITNPQLEKSAKNLHVSIVYKEHPLFKIEGDNVLMDLPVPFTKAILGGTVEIPTLRGRVSFQLPSNTHGGYIIQLKGQGFPLSAKAKKRGNMLVTVLIDIPSHFSAEEKNWIKKIQDRKQLCPKVAEFDIKTKLLLKKRKN